MSPFQSTAIDRVELFVMNKNVEKSIAVSEKTIKEQISYHTTILDSGMLSALDSLCRSFQDAQNIMQKPISFDIRLLVEYFQEDVLLHTLVVSTSNLLILDNNKILPSQCISILLQLLEGYIPEQLGWMEKNNVEDFVFDKRDTMLDFQVVYDGFEVELTIDPNVFWRKKAKNYFTKSEIQAIKNQVLIDLELKIDVNQSKILRFSFLEIIVSVDLEESLRAKLLKVLEENIFIQSIKNVYQKKNQILYRPLSLHF